MGSTRFKLEGQFIVSSFFESDRFDHLSASLIRGHFIQPFFFSIQNPHPRRSEYLVTGKCQKIYIEIADVDGQVLDSLCSVQQNRYLPFMSQPDNFPYGMDGSECIGDITDRYDFYPIVQKLLVFFEDNFPFTIDGYYTKFGLL